MPGFEDYLKLYYTFRVSYRLQVFLMYIASFRHNVPMRSLDVDHACAMDAGVGCAAINSTACALNLYPCRRNTY